MAMPTWLFIQQQRALLFCWQNLLQKKNKNVRRWLQYLLKVLKIFEPITFPKLISLIPFKADWILTLSSGQLVPIDTKVKPITNEGIFKLNDLLKNDSIFEELENRYSKEWSSNGLNSSTQSQNIFSSLKSTSYENDENVENKANQNDDNFDLDLPDFPEIDNESTENLDDMAEYYQTSDENRKQIIIFDN